MVRDLIPLGTPAASGPAVPALDDDEYGELVE
jgi:hypothetical protein